MASYLMHLYVGRKFVEHYRGVLDLSQFYLGCIIPDSVKVDGLASKETRWAAHIRSNNISEWYDNNIKFYHANKGSIDKSLLLGYVVHNITDAAFDEFFNDKIKYMLSKINIPPVTDLGLRWDDCFRFDNDQSKELWWTDEVLPALKRAVPIEINGINREDIEKLKKRITDENYFTFPEGNPVMVTAELVNELSNIVCKIIDGFISPEKG